MKVIIVVVCLLMCSVCYAFDVDDYNRMNEEIDKPFEQPQVVVIEAETDYNNDYRQCQEDIRW